MIYLFVLAVVGFIQNLSFTLVSRSRNSGDPKYHRRAAYVSNGIWFIAQVLLVNIVWEAIDTGEWWFIAAAWVVYTVSTSEGSVCMMKYLLKNEKGKRRVGAR